MTKLKIIISGGGTGGHIFPALAIAKAIEFNNDNVEFLFVGATGRMEMEKIPAAGYKIKGLWISGFQRRLTFRNFLFPIKILFSLFKSYIILKSFRPDLVIGTGGYASGPVLFMASKKGIPCLIQEQNSYPGITNKILSNYVERICVAYENMEKFFPKKKLIFTGNPVRKDILDFNTKKKKAKKFFNINNNSSTILVIGGSLGAKTINQAIADNLDFFKLRNINLIWQTGGTFYDKSRDFISSIDYGNLRSFDFIKEMDLAYASADIIISRAGAIAISELSCVGKPTILIPSPNVSENHQYKNAQSLVNKNAALLVEDSHASRKLVDNIISILDDMDLQKKLIKNIKKIAIKDSAERIADIAITLIK